jgi:hypothetical protein
MISRSTQQAEKGGFRHGCYEGCYVETTVNIIIVADTRVSVTCPRRKFSPERGLFSDDLLVVPKTQSPTLESATKQIPSRVTC